MRGYGDGYCRSVVDHSHRQSMIKRLIARRRMSINSTSIARVVEGTKLNGLCTDDGMRAMQKRNYSGDLPMGRL